MEKSAYRKENSVWNYYTTFTQHRTLDRWELQRQSKDWNHTTTGRIWDLILSDTWSLANAKETKRPIRNRPGCWNHWNHLRRNGPMSPWTSLHHCQSLRAETLALVVVDRLSKMIRIIPMKPNEDAPKFAKSYKEFVYRHHGLPLNIISDRDPIFMSKFWKAIFETLGISPSSEYHPQTDGQTEIIWRYY